MANILRRVGIASLIAIALVFSWVRRVHSPVQQDAETPTSAVVVAQGYGTAPGLEMKITPGKRAMSFRFDDLSGIAQQVPVNSRVDLLLVMDTAEKGGRAKLFMENMRVLGIGWTAHGSNSGRAMAVATIEVTPDEGQRLALATTQGHIQLMLRGYGDWSDFSRRQADVVMPAQPCYPRGVVRDLLLCGRRSQQIFVSDSSAKAVPAPDTNTVTILRGRN